MGRIDLMLQSSPGITCMKTLLMVFNFIFWISGVAILALGVWMKVQLYVYMELTTVYYNEAPYVLMGVGGGIVVVGLLGCCCTAKGKSFFLYLFASFLVVVFIAELAVGIAGFAYRGKLESGFNEGLTDAMDQYAKDEEKKSAMDGLQEGLLCCGKDTYEDWFSVAWDGSVASDSVPASCCKAEDKSTCVHTNLNAHPNATDIYTEDKKEESRMWIGWWRWLMVRNNDAWCPDDSVSGKAAACGCYSLVTSFMETNFGIIGGVAIGFAFLQCLGAMLACCLAKNINKSKYEQVA